MDPLDVAPRGEGHRDATIPPSPGLRSRGPRDRPDAHPDPLDRRAEPETKDKAPANRLAKETSPYLLLHAHNPVDWYPWGPEALARAKAENRPIFLSVGYSAATGVTSWSARAS